MNQELLQYFNGHKEYYLFYQMAEEMKREQRQLVEQFEKMDATLSYGQRELDLLSETLYEKELNLLREETTKHGQIETFGTTYKEALDSVSQATAGMSLAVGLTGKGMDSIKAYISETYPALCKAAILHSENVVRANNSYLEGYLSECGSEDLDSDELERQIAELDTIVNDSINSINEIRNTGLTIQEDQNTTLDLGTDDILTLLIGGINRNNDMKAVLTQKLNDFKTFSDQSTSYFDQLNDTGDLLTKAMTAMGVTGDGTVGAGTWTGTGFAPIDKSWIDETNKKWSERPETRAGEFKQEISVRSYCKVDVTSGASVWMWVKDPSKVGPEDIRFNEKFKDYLALLNQPQNSEYDDYIANFITELKTGINQKTGEPLTNIEKLQRWSVVASTVTTMIIGAYYAKQGFASPKTVNRAETEIGKYSVETLNRDQTRIVVENLLDNGELSLKDLQNMIPEGTPNGFNPAARIPEGAKAKYEFVLSDGQKATVRWHGPDSDAAIKYPNSVSGSRWTAQVKVGNKQIKVDGTWTKNQGLNEVHIPIKGK